MLGYGVAGLIEESKQLKARIKRLEEALRPFAGMADGRKRKDVMGNVCFSQDTLLAARAALEDK